MEKVNGNFPKTEKIEIRLRQDLADRLPQDKKEKNAYICRAVEYAINREKWMKKAHSAKSEAKTLAARENGKKGGRPKIYQPEKPGKLEVRIRNKKGRDGYLRAVPYPDHYEIFVFYDGATDPFPLKPEFQPKKGFVPDVEPIAELAGFELI